MREEMKQKGFKVVDELATMIGECELAQVSVKDACTALEGVSDASREQVKSMFEAAQADKNAAEEKVKACLTLITENKMVLRTLAPRSTAETNVLKMKEKLAKDKAKMAAAKESGGEAGAQPEGGVEGEMAA